MIYDYSIQVNIWFHCNLISPIQMIWTERTVLRPQSENIFKFLLKLLTPSDCDNIIWYQNSFWSIKMTLILRSESVSKENNGLGFCEEAWVSALDMENWIITLPTETIYELEAGCFLPIKNWLYKVWELSIFV